MSDLTDDTLKSDAPQGSVTGPNPTIDKTKRTLG